MEGLVAGTKEVEAYNDAMEQLIRRNEEFVTRSLGVTVAQRDINKERERAIEISREEIAVAQEAQAAGVAGGFGVGGGAGAAADSTASQTAAGGKTSTVELVVRNEQSAATGQTVRLSNDQIDQLVRKVLDAIERDRAAAGR